MRPFEPHLFSPATRRYHRIIGIASPQSGCEMGAKWSLRSPNGGCE